MSIEHIDKEAQRYAEARAKLAELVADMQDEQRKVMRQYLPKIRRAVATAQERREALYTDVKSAPEAFAKPKSRILHGIRVGYRKAKGKLSWSDPKKVLKRLRELRPDDADQYIRVKEEPDKTELARLPARTLKQLGVEITKDQDIPIVEPTDTEVDKIVDALIEEGKSVEEAA